MKSKESRIIQRRLRSSYITSVISISLVLFMLGLIGILLLNTHRISVIVKENIGFSVILKESVKEADMLQLQKNLDASRFIKSTEYISKERAAKEFQQELGEDFVSFLGFNPLLSSIEVKLYAAYANQDSIALVEKEIQKYDQVKEVYYQKSLVNLINENVRNISLIIFIFCGILFVIAISLINNTIRLSIYSKRFIINTMQLVGATKSFIRKPYLYKSILHGIYCSGIAITILLFFLNWLERQLGGMIKLNDINTIFILCSMLLIIGIVINFISTWFAVNKYLRLSTEELYY
jgi:cell division transport system permease protein